MRLMEVKQQPKFEHERRQVGSDAKSGVLRVSKVRSLTIVFTGRVLVFYLRPGPVAAHNTGSPWCP